MQKRNKLWLIGAISILLLAATGCFQAAGTGPDSLSVAENTNPTWTPFPSDTPPPQPTAEPIVVTATQDPNELAAPPPTTDLNSSAAFPTPDPGFGQVPTTDFSSGQIPTDDFSVAQVPTLDTFAQVEPQVDQALDPIYVTATFIVARATMTEAFFMTATAGGPLITDIPTQSPLIPTATLAPVPGGTCTHTVVAGDNLFRISMQYNMTPQELASANGIPNMNVIVVGQQITIPNCGSSGGPAPDPGVPPPSGGGSVYTVKQGDTLFKISLQYGVPVTSIAAANGISNINLILINQQLTIPAA